MTEIDRTLERSLAAPFAPHDLEWRLDRCGKGANGKIWAMCLVYVTNRAIMRRLDECCGIGGWVNLKPEPGPDGGVIQGLQLKIDGVWLTKWDGASNTNIDAVKGGLSGAMKRAAVLWGIGRSLYRMSENFADVSETGVYYGQTKEKERFRWSPSQKALDFVHQDYDRASQLSEAEVTRRVETLLDAISQCNDDEMDQVGRDIAAANLPEHALPELRTRYAERLAADADPRG